MKKVTTPFLNYAQETLESLEKCKFKVKANNTGGYSVFMKNIIAVGPLPTKDYAEAMAADFNDFVKIRIELISNTLKVTEEKIKDVLTKSEEEVGDSLVSTRDGKVFVHGGGDGKKNYEYEKGTICPTEPGKIVFDPNFTKRGMQIPQEIGNSETTEENKDFGHETVKGRATKRGQI